MPKTIILILAVWTIIIGGIMIVLPRFDFFCIKCGNIIDVLIGIVSVILGASALVVSKNIAARK